MMGYNSLIKKGVKKAFDSLKDIPVLVTLSQKSATGFNFATSSVVTSTTTTKEIKGILVEKKKKDMNTETQFIFNSEDLSAFDVYDKLTTPDLAVWNAKLPYSSDGYLTYVTVTRGS